MTGVQTCALPIYLFYRLNVVPINIPPLRERGEDVPLLIDYFSKMYSLDRQIKISTKALAALVNYHWPGNVREVRNIAQRLALLDAKEIKLTYLPPEINTESPILQIAKACNLCFTDDRSNFNQIVHCIESNLVKEALKQTIGNQSEAAKILGLSLSTFRDKMRKYAHNPSC